MANHLSIELEAAAAIATRTATGRIIDSTTVVTTIPNTTGTTSMIPSSHSDRMLHQRKQTVTNASCCSSVSSYCSTASIGVTSISQMSGISISSCSAITTGSSSVYLPASAAAAAVIPSFLEHQEHSSRKSSCSSTAIATTLSLPAPHRHQNDIHHQHHNEEEEESHIGSTAAGKKCSIALDCLTPSAVSSSSQPMSFPKCKVSYPEEEEEIMSMEQSIEYYNACTWQMYHRIMKSRRSRSRSHTNSHHQHQKKLFISTLNQATVSYEEVDSHCESLLQRQASLGVEAFRVPTCTTKTTLAEEDNKDDIIFKLDLI